MPNELLDPFRHNAWATRKLLAFCERLTPEQLGSTSEGTYGSILATLQHLVGAEGRYRARLAGEPSPWPVKPEETDDLAQLGDMAEDVAAFWEELATVGFDPERTVTWRYEDADATGEARAGVLVAQALNHGNEHRAQIYTVLTTIGVEPPDLDAWSYAQATGRFREIPTPPDPH
jgi:uncharacterized damage-inducible protein DinB